VAHAGRRPRFGQETRPPLSNRQKIVELRSQKCSFEDKFSANVVHVGGWMKSIPEDVVIRIRHDNASRKIESGAGAVCEAKDARLVREAIPKDNQFFICIRSPQQDEREAQ
jgi:hypothetical protein